MNEDGELQQMIANLRQEIEERTPKQQMAGASQDQVTNLTGTIRAMRDELERMQAGKQDSIQEAVADANQEVNQRSPYGSRMAAMVSFRRRFRSALARCWANASSSVLCGFEFGNPRLDKSGDLSNCRRSAKTAVAG